MKRTKTQKGITLVALIITIVVLLILAIVTIGAVRDSNIIAHAQNAATGYNVAKEKEEELLKEYEAEIEKVLAKDRIYRVIGEDFYIKITKDNTGEMGNSSGILGEAKFEYVTVTNEIITKVNESLSSSEKVSENLSDYSRALKADIGDGEFMYLLLSKDEKILYYAGILLYLDGIEPETSEWTTYGIESEYYLVGTNTAYVVSEGNITYTFAVTTDKTLEEYYDESYTIDASIKDASKVLVYNYNNIDMPMAIVISENLYTFNQDNNTNTISINRTYSANNQINYRNVLEQIQ